MQIRFALIAVLPLGLAACDPVATDVTDVEAYNALATEYNALGNAYSTAFIVPAVSLAATGTATYDGVTRIVVDTPASTQVLGDARIGVNFTNDLVAAQFGSFVGRANGGAIVAWTEQTPVVANGVIDVLQPGGQFIQTTMTGELLSADGDRLSFNPGHQLDGTFRDTAPSALSAPDAMVLQSGPGSIRLNGLNYGNDLGNACETCVRVIAED